jgi:glycosyltransferase involved in cell wall biosynthesis
MVTRLSGWKRPYVTLHAIQPVRSDPLGYAHLRRAGLAVIPPFAARAFSAFPDPSPGWVFVPHASERLGALDRLGPPAASAPTFLWIGRLDEPKRPDRFIDAIIEVARTCPEVRGLIAGDGPQSEELAARISRSGAPVELLGHIDDVRAYLEQAWAVVLLSESEGVPLSLEEAMWAGRAIVGSPLPGVRWLVGDAQQGGMLADDSKEIELALTRLCNPAVAGAVGAAAADRLRTLLEPDHPWPFIERAYGYR